MENKPSKSAEEIWIERGKFLLLFLTFAYGAYTFAYKEQYIPSQRPVFPTMSGSLEEVGREGNLALVLARVHIVNNKDRTIFTPAIWFTVTGFKINEKQSSEQTNLLKTPEDQPLTNTFTRYSEQDSEVIAGWKNPHFEYWYVPGADSTEEMLFYVPLDLYQAIQLKVQVIHSKSKEDVTSVEWKIAEDGSFVPVIQTRDHIQLNAETGGGLSWFTTTLSLIEPPQEEE